MYLYIEHHFDAGDWFLNYDHYLGFRSKTEAIKFAKESYKDYLASGEYKEIQYLPVSKNDIFCFSCTLEKISGNYIGDRIFIEIRGIPEF